MPMKYVAYLDSNKGAYFIATKREIGRKGLFRRSDDIAPGVGRRILQL